MKSPWWYANRKTGGERNNKTKFGGGAQKHYDLLKAHEIIDPNITLDVKSITAQNCALFMWVTMPILYDMPRRATGWMPRPDGKFLAPHDALTVLQGWGFYTYSTAPIVWVKTTKDGSNYKYGPGNYTASNVEMLVLAIKGRGMRPQEWDGVSMLPSIIQSPRQGHSEKPRIVHDMLDKMYPGARKIELFARERYSDLPQWDFWGNQLDV